MARFYEGIIDRVSRVFGGSVNEPENTSDKETRKSETGYSVSAQSQGGYNWYKKNVQVSRDILKKYQEYNEMDIEDTEVETALNIYADNAVGSDSEDEEVVEIITEDETIKGILEQVKKDLDLDSELWSIARNIVKYGENFEEIVFDDKLGFNRLKNLYGARITRNEDKFGRLPKADAFSQISKETGQVIANFARWQVIHFRIRVGRNDKRGRSLLYSIRKTYKQLAMMEDSLVISRLSRAPLRYKYLIDVEGLTPKEAQKHITDVKTELKKKRTVNQVTGKMNIELNPMSIEEDIFVGVKQGSPADVDTLQGQSNIGQLTDIEYFQNKKLTGLNVPKTYMGLERDVNAKATLTEQDVQFARTVRRIQQAIQGGLRDLFDLALLLEGKSPEDVEYEIKMPTISFVDEMRRWQVEQIKIRIATMLKASLDISDTYIYKTYLDLTDEEIAEIEVDRDEEVRKVADRTKDVMDKLGTGDNAKGKEEAMLSNSKAKIRRALKDDFELLQMLTDWELGKEADVYDIKSR